MRIKSLLVAIVLCLMVVQSALAAIPGGTIWELRSTNGSDTNGGGFVPAITSISSKTDLVVSAGSNVQVSSASYGFTSADVGRTIKVTAGTGWTVGYYQVLSVNTSVATLDHSPASINATGGSFTIYYGVDYTQQNSKNTTGNNISTTDLVTAGTTTIVSATASFTADIVGNVVYIAGGTGSITGGWYEVTAYTNATTVTVDRATGLTTGTGATLNIGGALKTISQLGSIIVSNNGVFIKNEASYATTTGFTLSASGTSVIGYNTSRFDQGHPTLIDSPATSSITVLNFGGSYVANLTLDCNSAGTSAGLQVGSFATVYNNKAQNCASAGLYAQLGNQGTVLFISNEVFNMTSSSSIAIQTYYPSGFGFQEAIGNYVHDGIGVGIKAVSWVQGNIVANMSGGSSDCYQNVSFAFGNTAYNCGRNGIYFNNNANTPSVVLGNLLVNNGGYGIAYQNTIIPTANNNPNAFYNNTSGNTNANYSVFHPYYNSTVSDITLTASPFVNPSSGNFGLNTTAGGGALVRGTGWPLTYPGLSGSTSYPSFGVIQPNNSPIVGGVCVSGQ